ncbi:hypothetical protein [Malonomonas rubra]|uniref:hypothetical protein n=1 Tax=Malonomonas rubra TaxID=57040 RepID=UPI0026F37B5C|nr:hypothetical protein [Malonomonas rubra]
MKVGSSKALIGLGLISLQLQSGLDRFVGEMSAAKYDLRTEVDDHCVGRRCTPGFGDCSVTPLGNLDDVVRFLSEDRFGQG